MPSERPRHACGKTEVRHGAGRVRHTQYLALQEVRARWDYFQRHIRPLIEQTEGVIRDALHDRDMPANEIVDVLEGLARMRLNDLELRYQHQRLRTQLELLLQCPLADLAADMETPVESADARASRPAPRRVQP